MTKNRVTRLFISVVRIHSKQRVISSKPENGVFSPAWRFCCSDAHMGPDDGLKVIEQKHKLKSKGIKKRRTHCHAVLDYFDQQYSQELGQSWISARAVLLDPNCWQYGVMLNRFTSLADIKHNLQSRGFSCFLSQLNTPVSLREEPLGAHQSNSHSLARSRPSPNCPHLDDGHVHLHNDCHSETVRPKLEPSPTPAPFCTLQCYIHPYPLRFPSQAHRPGQIKQYFLLNAASLLPVLALQVKDGEKVLDLCSAPGGKALAIMQVATPASLCCNEPDRHRRDWLAKTLESFLPLSVTNRVIVSGRDGRYFGETEAGAYDKVLVDAPCSNDRSWLFSSNNHQGALRLKQRTKLPLLQAQLLRSALAAVRPGGVVVYSTCTLSCAENHAVVETVLSDFPEAEPEDLSEEFVARFSNHFAFYPTHSNHGHPGLSLPEQSQGGTAMSYKRSLGVLVVPQRGKTWGPMFLSRIRRKR